MKGVSLGREGASRERETEEKREGMIRRDVNRSEKQGVATLDRERPPFDSLPSRIGAAPNAPAPRLERRISSWLELEWKKVEKKGRRREKGRERSEVS